MRLVKPRYDYWTTLREDSSIQVSRNKFYILSDYTFFNRSYDGSATLIDVETYKEYRITHFHRDIETLLDSSFVEVIEA